MQAGNEQVHMFALVGAKPYSICVTVWLIKGLCHKRDLFMAFYPTLLHANPHPGQP